MNAVNPSLLSACTRKSRLLVQSYTFGLTSRRLDSQTEPTNILFCDRDHGKASKRIFHDKFQESCEKRVLVRIATHALMTRKVQEWREKHSDWESLAAFAMSKNTGRRFKKKSKKTSSDSQQNPQEKIEQKNKTKKTKGLATKSVFVGDNTISMQDGSDQTQDPKTKEQKSKRQKTNSLNTVTSSDVGGKSATNTIQNVYKSKEMAVRKVKLQDFTADDDIEVEVPDKSDSLAVFVPLSPEMKQRKDAFFLGASSSDSEDQEEGDIVSEPGLRDVLKVHGSL